MGEEPVWSEGQRARYRHGPANIRPGDVGVVGLEEMVAAFNRSQERLAHGLERMSYDDMCRPSGYATQTIGDSLAYFHFHEAQHVGQILYLAQFAGKKGVWLS
ncbi:MAG: DinB family protein [Chloroflexi bacterium]|nr:DinB family protein [Chloroflexota bacterium]MCI0646429.1 DinB family protein [Chloroflexota bacterium]